MKKLFFSFCILFCFTTKAQIINIPDANFKQQLLLASETYGIAYDCAIGSYYKIDANNNGEIEESEALAVCTLLVPSQNISDLTGIEKFTNLTGLDVGINNLSTLDLSQLINLQALLCYQNDLTSLNINTNINLTSLSCNQNQITSLNFSNNPQLLRVNCSDNLLTSLDFSANSLFNDLACKNNPNLTTIKIKNGVTQQLGSQSIYNQCWSNCPNLNYICADANEIAPLQTYLSNCGVSTSGITINSDCVLSVEEFDFASIKVYPNPNDGVFTINFDSIVDEAEIEVYTLVGQLIYQEKVLNTSEKLLNIGGISSGAYLLKITIKEQTIYKRIIVN